MPELTVTHIALLAVLAIVGAIAGWFARERRAAQEQEAVKTMWQEEIDRQRKEQDRLADQNKGLMEQISQHQAQHSEMQNRAAELSSGIRDAYARRDELQGEVDARDARIEALEKDLRNWQDRLPPLIDRYRARNEEAEQLENELEEALDTIRKLRADRDTDADGATGIEPVHDAGQFTDGLEASNDEEDEYVDEVTDEETPVFLEESTMIESAALPESLAAPEAVDDEDFAAADVDDDDDDDRDDENHDDDGDWTSRGETLTGAGDDAPPERDNLKKIKGVGPAIEKTLNEMGIFSFRQIAEMSEYDIDRVARRLKGFHSRIHREDWIGQARTLLDKAALA